MKMMMIQPANNHDYILADFDLKNYQYLKNCLIKLNQIYFRYKSVIYNRNFNKTSKLYFLSFFWQILK